MTDKTPDAKTESSIEPTDAAKKSSNKPANRYEGVMVAAREARRINDRVAMTRIEPKEKITTEAIRRAGNGDVMFSYDDRGEVDEPLDSDFVSGDSEQ